MNSKTFYSNGKLLLTGEYVVLDGATSLAVPTQYSQSLKIEPIELPQLIWTSLDEKNHIWFEDTFHLNTDGMLQPIKQGETSRRLVEIVNAAKTLNPTFLNTGSGYNITTRLDFPRNWGLGTSSTLINNMAQWAQIDAYQLLEHTFGGSGYDIACAQSHQPITYQLQNNKPIVKPIEFNPSFKDQLYFVHLNKKQNSRESIKHYNANKENLKSAITKINDITTKLITCKTLETFENLISLHETIISKLIKQPPIKTLLFNDFKGSIKSLGAWGGDFILVISKENPKPYFKSRGFETVIPYTDMVLNKP